MSNTKTRLTKAEVKAIQEKPSYYDLINFYEREDRDLIVDDGAAAWVSLDGVIELWFPLDYENPATEQQLKELFILADEEEFINRANTQGHLDGGYPHWPAIRHQLAEWLEQPCLDDLKVTFE